MFIPNRCSHGDRIGLLVGMLLGEAICMGVGVRIGEAEGVALVRVVWGIIVFLFFNSTNTSVEKVAGTCAS